MKQNICQVISAALEAGSAIMEVYNSDFAVEVKSDESPLTLADRLSNERIKMGLSSTAIPLLSEEEKEVPFTERSYWNRFWLVDPLDGTKEFIKKNGEFTVNIALIEEGYPVFGVVYLPAKQHLYFGSADIGSYFIETQLLRMPIELNDLMERGTKLPSHSGREIFTIVASRSHMSPETQDFVEKKREEHGNVELVSSGSSIKLCMVAGGQADVYPRLAPTMEWDTAAAHAVAKFAGCKVLDYHTGEELRYNKENLLNPHFIVTR